MFLHGRSKGRQCRRLTSSSTFPQPTAGALRPFGKPTQEPRPARANRSTSWPTEDDIKGADLRPEGWKRRSSLLPPIIRSFWYLRKRCVVSKHQVPCENVGCDRSPSHELMVAKQNDNRNSSVIPKKPVEALTMSLDFGRLNVIQVARFRKRNSRPREVPSVAPQRLRRCWTSVLDTKSKR